MSTNTAARPVSARIRKSAGRNSRRYYRRGTDYSGGFAEFFITQCIVSGVILCAALVICTVKTPFTQALREDIRLAVTGGEYNSGPVNDIAGFVTDAFMGLIVDLGGEKEPVAEEFSGEIVPVSAVDKDFRIDEEILESIYNGENMDIQLKNETAPQD